MSPVITPFSEIHFVWDGVPPVLSFLRGPQLIFFFTPELYCAYAEGYTSSPKRVRKHRDRAKLFRPSKLAHLSYLFDRGFEKGLESILSLRTFPPPLNILGCIKKKFSASDYLWRFAIAVNNPSTSSGSLF